MNRKIVVQARQGIKQDSISKTAKAKRVGSMAQVMGHLFSDYEALSSTPSTTKKNVGWHGSACL
jgi:hypothetical protein